MIVKLELARKSERTNETSGSRVDFFSFTYASILLHGLQNNSFENN